MKRPKTLKSFAELVHQQTNLKASNIVANYMDGMLSAESFIHAVVDPEDEWDLMIAYGLMAIIESMHYTDDWYNYEPDQAFALLAQYQPMKDAEFDKLFHTHFFDSENYIQKPNGEVVKIPNPSV